MFRILEKQPLNPTVTKMVIEAPLVAQKAKAGQFVILRAHERGERIPLTVADYDPAAGTVRKFCFVSLLSYSFFRYV